MTKNIVILVFVSFTLSAFAWETPSSVKAKYSRLYELQVEQLKGGSLKFDKAKLFRRGNLRVLSLKGDRFEMAFQHGRLLKEEIAEGALPQVALLLDRSVRNAVPALPLIPEIVIQLFTKKYPDTILQYAIDQGGGNATDALLEGYGLSEGSGLDLNTVVRGAVGPESLQVMLSDRLKGKALSMGGGVPANQCSDFAAWGEKTRDGEILIGRNTDYPVNGEYDSHPMVAYFEPTDGIQKYMAISSVGLHNAGVVGYNESGIYLGVHTVPTLDASAEGFPVFLIGQEVLRNARTMKEAIELFNVKKPAAGWTYFLVSTKEKLAVSIELSNKKMGVLASGKNYHTQSNHYRSKEMDPSNFVLNYNVYEDSIARVERMNELLHSGSGSLDVEGAIQILGDKYDRVNKKVSGLGNVVSTLFTLTSAVFQPEKGKVFVGSGLAPVPNSTFIELPTVDQFNAETFEQTPFQQIENTQYQKNHPEIAKAEQLFIKGKIEFESNLNPEAAFRYISEASRIDPDNAAYAFVSGIMALKAGYSEEAFDAFTQTANSRFPHYQRLGHYYRGRMLAHEGRAKESIEEFNKVVTTNHPFEKRLKAAAQKAKKQVSRWGCYKLRPAGIVIYISEADMVEY